MTKFKDEGINSPRVTLTSLFSDLQRLFTVFDKALGITQNLVERNKILTIDSQFKESCLTPDLGSKIEKRLPAIEFD